MEFFLNFAWVLLATLMFCLWLRFAPRKGDGRGMQFVALALLALILFPVISVTDDLQAVLNPAETDSCLRRDHACGAPHCAAFPVAALPPPMFGALSLGILRAALLGSLFAPVADHPARGPIQNRPPPAA